MKQTHQQPLNAAEAYVIRDKGTERPFSGAYWNHFEEGLYLCRQCRTPLYRWDAKFESSCGWPSFDDEIPGKVHHQTDADGVRTEITCNSCDGHLGHVFSGEGYTEKNTRHCVNSLSLTFVKVQRAIFASGCFWGTQYHFDRLDGVLLSAAGYAGGTREHPTYQEVCTGTTGHVEAVEVLFDPEVISYEEVAIRYFETHDPEQEDGQGPDIGSQYESVIFYENQEQLVTAQKLIDRLAEKGIHAVTRLEQADVFYPAEKYHQHYYDRKGSTPYCHIYTKRF